MTTVEGFRNRFSTLLLGLLWANATILVGAVPVFDMPLAAAGLALALLATLAWRIDRIGWATRQITSIAALGQVMLLVYAFRAHPYQADMHMYFFAVLAVLAGWLDWRIFAPATLAIALHHLVLSLVYPAAVFPDGNDVGRVVLHGAIVIVQALALSWMVQALRRAIERSERERQEADQAREVADAARRDVAETTERAATERRQILHRIAGDFERRIAGIARDVITSIQSLRVSSQQMSSGATEVSTRSHAASLSSRRTSTNAVAITRATSGLARSFTEVERQVDETTRIVAETTQQAHAVLGTVANLSRKADEISDITGVISTIAQQTNLLALNAAIEAARLGQSGGGFTVVAQEIKSLAAQTWRATEEIQGQIEAIHSSGTEAASAIDAMNTTIGSLNRISTAVATVVEQQNVAVGEIADKIDRVAQEAVAAGDHIEFASRVAAETGQAASHVADSADRLALQSEHLDLEVARFLGHIRAA